MNDGRDDDSFLRNASFACRGDGRRLRVGFQRDRITDGLSTLNSLVLVQIRWPQSNQADPVEMNSEILNFFQKLCVIVQKFILLHYSEGPRLKNTFSMRCALNQ